MNSTTRLPSRARLLRIASCLAIVSCYGDQWDSADPHSTPVAHDDIQKVQSAVTTDPVALLAGTLLPTATDVGSTPGAFAVTKDGQSSYTIPIWAPPGIGGMEPKLALSYNSAGDDGYVGTGWSLTGLSRITRCPRTYAQDRLPQAMTFDENLVPNQLPDALCLDGARLVLVSGTYGKALSEYRTQPDSFAKIRIEEADNHGATLIKVSYKDGRIGFFGGGSNAWISGLRFKWSPGDPNLDYDDHAVRYGWLLSRLEDRSGNSLQVTYQQSTHFDGVGFQEPLPGVVRYTGRRGVGGTRAVKMYYVDRPGFESRRFTFISGFPLARTKLLDHVDVEAPDPQTGASAVFRRYQLSYVTAPRTFRMRLDSVKECDGDPSVPRAGRTVACKRPTTFTWRTGPQGFTDLPQVGWNGNYKGYEKYWSIQPADLDNDGRDDILYRLAERWYYRLARPDGAGGIAFAPPVRLNIAEDLLSDGPTDLILADRNNDGFVDIVAVGANWCRLFRGSGTTFAREATSCSLGSNKAVIVDDLDGNGLPDIAMPTTTGQGTRTWSIWQAAIDVLSPILQTINLDWNPAMGTGWNAYVVDTDGDGKQEILDLSTGTAAPGFLAKLQKVTFGTSNDWLASPTTLRMSDPAGKTRRYFFADFNGDGLSDALSLVEGDSAPTVALSSGRDFAAGTVQSSLAGTPYTVRIGHRWDDSNDPGIRFMDYNMDGRQDILLVDNGALRDVGQSPPATRTKMAVLLSQNAGFGAADDFVPVDVNVPVGDPADGIDQLGGGVHNYKTTQLLDANGDGLTDIVQVVGGVLHLYLRVGEAPFVLQSVTDGMGDRTTVSYKPLIDSTVYTPSTSCAHPVVCVKRGPVVVSEYRRDSAAGRDTHAYQLTYTDGRVDTQGHGWLGFLRRTTSESARKTTTTESFDNFSRIMPYRSGDDRTIYPFLGLQYSLRVQTDLSTGGVSATRFVQRTQTYDYASIKSPSGDLLTTYPRLTRILQDDTDPTPDKHRRVETVLTYVEGDEDVGNLDSQTVTTTLAGGKTQLDSIKWSNYYNDRTTWVVGLPRAVVTQSNLDGKSQRRLKEYVWTGPTRLLLDEYTEKPSLSQYEPYDSDAYLRTHYDRNDRGQVTQVTRFDTSGTRRQVTIAYDLFDGTFPYTETDSLNHVTTVNTHPALGVTRAIRSPGGAQTEWQYDGFGRQRTETRPGGGGTSTSYARLTETGTSDDRYVLQSTIDRVGGGQLIVTNNRLGQEIERRFKNLDGTYSYTKSSYDVLGRPTGVTKLTRVGLSPDAETTYAYDNLDRLVSIKRPDEAAVSTGGTASSTAMYTGFYQTVYTNEVGQVTTLIEDELGRPRKTIRKGPQGDIPTEFTYGPFGLPDTVLRKNAAGTRTITSTLVFDAMGRRTRLVDPDLGDRRFYYNGFGQLRQETDAAGSTTTYTFDAVGRLKSRQDSDGITSFTWDTAANGFGLLGGTSSPDGTAVGYSYDAFGRLQGETWADLSMSQTYDSAGRRDTLTYPKVGSAAPLVVRNTYDADSGELSMVSNNATGAVFWKALERNGAMQLTRESLGNGEETVRQYFQRTGRLQRIDTSKIETGVAKYLQKFGYDYYANGSLRQHLDDLSGDRWGYDYDPLDRLGGWYKTDGAGNRIAGWTTGWAYDDFGNLTGRDVADSGTGRLVQSVRFDFGMVRNAGPHAVTHSNWGDYSYDKRGNQISRPGGETVSYTAFDLPRTISGPTPTTFGYTAKGERARKTSSSTKYTSYLASIFEKRVNGSSTDLVHYISGAERTVAQLVRPIVNGVVGPDALSYFHDDRLGSVETISDQAGAVVERNRRDPFGARVSFTAGPLLAMGATAPFGGPSGVTMGFTEHEEDGELGLINMRGRVYDPRLAKFLTADPIVQAPFEGQAYNRYAYALNNPLKYTDPSGFDWTCPSGSDYFGPGYGCTEAYGYTDVGPHDQVVARARAETARNGGTQTAEVTGERKCDSEGNNCVDSNVWTVTIYNVKKEEPQSPAKPPQTGGGSNGATGQATGGRITPPAQASTVLAPPIPWWQAAGEAEKVAAAERAITLSNIVLFAVSLLNIPGDEDITHDSRFGDLSTTAEDEFGPHQFEMGRGHKTKADTSTSSEDEAEVDGGHRKGARESTREKHEDGDARRRRDQGGEKGDARRPYQR